MNYFNYFTEIEEHFQRKRGAQVWLSPVDWALIGSWQEAGIPLEAVLAGIDRAFEKFDSGKRRDTQRRRALVYCAAAVLEAAEAMQQAAVGAPPPDASQPQAAAREADAAFSPVRIAAFLAGAEQQISAWSQLAAGASAVEEICSTLRRLADACAGPAPLNLEEIDRVLTVLDDKLQALLLQTTPVEVMVGIRAGIAGELAPYRRNLRAEQLAMIERQFLQRRLLEHARLPRLSLFYMP